MNQTQQLANSIIMVKPIDFGFNEQTGLDNEFQNKPQNSEAEHIKQLVTAEFNNAAEKLAAHGLQVLLLGKEHTNEQLPDAVFPNNWFSTQSTGHLTIFPMKTSNRKAEVQPDQLVRLLRANNYDVGTIVDLRTNLGPEQALEGTGSLIFHHPTNTVFAALSDRCQSQLLAQFSERFNYQLFSFNTQSKTGSAIYHTNVMMSCGEDFAVVATPVICENDRDIVLEALNQRVNDVIEISEEQMASSFCGNILQLKSGTGTPLIAMSESAFRGFNSKQLSILEKHGELVICAIPNIERIGGGSMRCMLAENFLPNAN
jgi:hypothetical protein